MCHCWGFRKAVRDRAALLQRVIDGMPEAIVVRDSEGRSLCCNVAHAALLGRSPQEILDRAVEDLFPPAQAARIRWDDQEVLASGEQVCTEETVTDPDGAPVRLDVTRRPLRGRGGVVMGVLAIARRTAAPIRVEAPRAPATPIAPAIAVTATCHGDVPVDEERLAALLDMAAPAHLRSLLAGALEGARTARRRIADAKDLLVVVAEARTLRDTSGTLGLAAIAQAAARIEQAAREGRHDTELLAQLAAQVEEARRALAGRELL